VKQYHIACGPGDLARYILLCGDPERARKTKMFFEKMHFEAQHREFITFTGVYQGVPVSVMSTGIGCDNTEIAVIEACQCVERPIFIRIGSCGALQEFINLGDLIVTTEALRRENTSSFYASAKVKAVSDEGIRQALVSAAKILRFPYHVGKTCSTSSFYGGQGREIPGFPILDKKIVKKLRGEKVLNFEMESSLLFILAKISTLNIRAATICAVYADRIKETFIAKKEMVKAEKRCILAGLKAVKILEERRKKAG